MQRDGDDLPLWFDFEGQVIFVSNLSHTDIEQTIISRSHYISLNMTREEKLERIETLLAKLSPQSPMKAKREVFNLMKDVAPAIKDLNMRSFIKALQIRESMDTNWKPMTRYSLING